MSSIQYFLYLREHSRDDTPKHTQTIIDATQKETAIDQQWHSCETLICQHHQTILRFLSTAVMASTRWRVHKLYCQTTYIEYCNVYFKYKHYNCMKLTYLFAYYDLFKVRNDYVTKIPIVIILKFHVPRKICCLTAFDVSMVFFQHDTSYHLFTTQIPTPLQSKGQIPLLYMNKFTLNWSL
jgi:hypothetical protein